MRGDAVFCRTTSTYRAIDVGSDSWIFSSGPLRVTANFSGEPVAYDAAGRTATSTLAPWEAVVSVG